ncbi:FecR family protein [Larkinella harenae]
MGLPREELSTVEDFLGNNAFRTWVTDRRPEDQVYWQAWLVLNPDKKEIYEEAVATFLVLQGRALTISDAQLKAKTEEVLDQLPRSSSPITFSFRGRWGRWLSAAAVVSLLVWWQLGNPVSQRVDRAKKISDQQVTDKNWKLVKNETGQDQVVILPDNSSVLLSTGSQLRFQKRMNTAVREVFLEGEGFFEVTKNPARPFIVNTANLTTKVLGTSFQVRSFEGDPTAYVKVKTGKVAVSTAKSPEKTVLLTVNEELNLSDSKAFVKRANFSTEATASAPIAQQFAFHYTPVSEVFENLQVSYHMPIHYNQELLKHCTFTGQLNDVPFLEKVRLICLTIESTYEVVDNQVVIHSRSCN